MYLFAFLMVLTVQFAFSEERANNSDLRGRQVLFAIEHDKKNYTLTRSTAGDHSLILKTGDGSKHQKISSKTAVALDDQIAAEFINLKYFMGEVKTCKTPELIEMRGEDLAVCPEDKKRLAKVSELVRTIESKK